MLEVELLSLRGDPPRDTVVGTIALNDDGELIGIPASDEYAVLIRNILDSPVLGLSDRVVYPADAENWIRGLYREYRSYALRCTEAVEVGTA